MTTGMDPLYMALSHFRKNNYDQCVTICSEILVRSPYDQAAWVLKMRALTEQVYVDEIEAEEEGLAEELMDDNAIAQIPRPGTSLRTAATSTAAAGSGATSQAYRPVTQSGRLLSGVVRPGTQGGRPKTMEQALRTPRTSRTARPVTSSTGRFVRLGTASMLSDGGDGSGGPFINVARLNLNKYALNPAIGRPLFEYLLHQEGSVKHALDLAAAAVQSSKSQDWWWQTRLAICYMKLGLMRDSERQLRAALRQNPLPPLPPYILLGKVYLHMDQPLAALSTWKMALDRFPNDVSLMTHVGRTEEALNKVTSSIAIYKDVLVQDATNVEAIACIGMHHFYTDQPELALKFYRRLLQMGIHSAEVFNNLGLCCYYTQQYDMTLNCFERALSLAAADVLADTWYNIGHVALGIGDILLAFQCFRLAVANNGDHAEAYNNLGVIELRRGRNEQAQAFFQAAQRISSYLYEPHYNAALLSEKIGNFDASFVAVQRSLEAFPDHVDSQKLIKKLRKLFEAT